MPKIVIERTSQYANKMRKINVYINNQKVSSIKNGETKEISLQEGVHQIFAKIDWCKTKPLQFSLSANEVKKLQLGSDIKGANGFATIYKTLFDTSNFIYLKEA
jgi:DNA-directed RNA polymerase delta subunit